ncbi:mCG146923 [Mus musculus]|nr:mCG146923 [Mus musculus]
METPTGALAGRPQRGESTARPACSSTPACRAPAAPPEALLIPGPLPARPTPRAPGNSSPGSPLSLPTAGVTAGWPSPNPTFRKTRRSPPSTTEPEGCKTVMGRSLRQRTSGHRAAAAPF